MAKLYTADGKPYAYIRSNVKRTYQGPQKRRDLYLLRPSPLLWRRHPELKVQVFDLEEPGDLERWRRICAEWSTL